MFSKAKVGDRVFSIRFGWGTIVELDPTCVRGLVYCCVPDLRSRELWFNVNGKEDGGDLFPSVFWGEPKFEMPKRPLPELKVDTPILVRDEDWEDWRPAHFARFSPEGVATWMGGKTSYTTLDGAEMFWKQWKLPEEVST